MLQPSGLVTTVQGFDVPLLRFVRSRRYVSKILCHLNGLNDEVFPLIVFFPCRDGT